MKKLLIILSVLLAFSLVGCSTAENTSSETEINSSSVIETSSEEVSSTDKSLADSETYSDEIVSTETSSEVSSAEKPKEESKPTTTTQSSSTTTTSTNNTESKVENSSTPTQNQATHKDRIDITNPNEYIQRSWDEDGSGNKIENSDQYLDEYGNVYDCEGYFLYNLSEWGVFF